MKLVKNKGISMSPTKLWKFPIKNAIRKEQKRKKEKKFKTKKYIIYTSKN